jgi:hypothetical protein
MPTSVAVNNDEASSANRIDAMLLKMILAARLKPLGRVKHRINLNAARHVAMLHYKTPCISYCQGLKNGI